MSFLYPGALWALILLIVPIIVHLFTFHKTRTIHFSAVAFIEEIKDNTESKNKLKHLLILISRLLVIGFLVIAFAQPIIEKQDPLLTSSGLALYLDNSLSMSSNTGLGNTALEEGIAAVTRIIDHQPIERKHLFVTNAFSSFSNYSKSNLEIMEAISRIDYVAGSRQIQAVVDRMQLKSDNQSNLILISDFQKSTFGNPGLSIDSSKSVTLIPIQYDQTTSNIYVDTAYFSKPFSISNQENELVLEFRNTGARERNNVLVKLTRENQLLSTLTINLAPFSKVEVKFDVSPSLSDSDQLLISFEDFPVTFDNEYRIVVAPIPKPQIIIINNKESNRFLESVFSNESLFDVQSYSSGAINYDNLSQANLIVLNEFKTLPSWFFSNANSFNGDLVIIPPEDPSIENYQLVLNRSVEVSSDSTPYKLQIHDSNHPFYKGLLDTETDKIDMPIARNTIRISRPDEILIKNSLEVPYLFKINSIKSYVFAGPLSNNYTSIVEHAIFLPIMYRITQLSNRSNQVLSYHSSQRIIQIPLGKDVSVNTFTLVGSNFELMPPTQISQNNLTMALPPTPLDPGFYYLLNDSDTVQTLAFNASKEESMLRQYSFNELNELTEGMTNVDVANISTLASLNPNVKGLNLTTQLWKYALILAMIFLIVEILLVRFFK